ncbi:MAG: gliding motility lipoprotein GldH [Flavobacteriales bacterium]
MRILLFFLVVGFVSCQNENKKEVYHSFNNNTWNTDSIVSFELDNIDTTSSHDLYLMVRHTTNFKFQNLFLFTNFENQQDTLELFLSEKSGRWLGKGFGEIKELKIRIKENINFNENQDQIFSIEQAMRYEDLEKIINLTEIVAVGIGLYKSE